MTCHVLITILVTGSDVISLEFSCNYTRVQPATADESPVVANTRRLNQFRNKIVEYDIKSKYPEEYSTVDKVGSEKPLASKSCFV